MNKKILDLAALLQVPYVEPDMGYDISPNRRQIAFSWNKTGQWEVYVLDLVGKNPAKQITKGPGGKFNPQWSPDGTLLAYMLDLNGGEDFDLIVFDPATNAHKNVTPDTEEAIVPNFYWSPDGKQFAICSDRDGHFKTYTLSSHGGAWTRVLDTPNPDWEVKWSPDGSMLLVQMEGEGQDDWIYIVPLTGENPYPISIDGKTIAAKDACWSPDSREVVFSSNLGGSYDLGIWHISTKEIRWLTKNDRENEHPDWSPDGGQIVYITSDGPKTRLAVINIADSQITTFEIEPGVIYMPKFSTDGKEIFFVFDNPRHPDDIWKFDIAKETFSQITTSLPSYIPEDSFCLPQEIRYPGLDGTPVPALLYCPKEANGASPAVVYIHGGPNWLTQVTWDPLVQHMVSRGWVVLAPNYRGSTGYGREWQLANRFDLGGVDTNDVVAGVKYLADQGIAEVRKIAVTGRSWGGYLTMTCLTQYPGLWAAGSAIVPFLNWFTSHENSRIDLRHWDIQNFGTPEENHDLWYERSPYFFMDRIKAPVQLICGAHDVRCPASESRQAYEEMQKLGKQCEYLVYEDEGHSFLKTENQIDSKKRCVEFLEKYLI
jgi:dipeptidyl aminopeptidase/acylaminoacyl peptidase